MHDRSAAKITLCTKYQWQAANQWQIAGLENSKRFVWAKSSIFWLWNQYTMSTCYYLDDEDDVVDSFTDFDQEELLSVSWERWWCLLLLLLWCRGCCSPDSVVDISLLRVDNVALRRCRGETRISISGCVQSISMSAGRRGFDRWTLEDDEVARQDCCCPSLLSSSPSCEVRSSNIEVSTSTRIASAIWLASLSQLVVGVEDEVAGIGLTSHAHGMEFSLRIVRLEVDECCRTSSSSSSTCWDVRDMSVDAVGDSSFA